MRKLCLAIGIHISRSQLHIFPICQQHILRSLLHISRSQLHILRRQLLILSSQLHILSNELHTECE